ncbi:ribonuclease H-like protein [Pyrenochaeta sp. DS3sAY3a]|nr:ribonuclease H-like protein [Pyrenochaeta sp. DS3sAY3a]
MADKEGNSVLQSLAEVEAVVNACTQNHDTLTWHIPDDVLRTAMLAPPKTRASYWSANFYRGPNGERRLIHLCTNFTVAERAARHFLAEKVVGFDIEWKPWGSPTSIKQNVSLIQLACENRIALFHISQFPGTTIEQLLPPSLRTVLESPDILKVGVAVKGDFSRLAKHLYVKARGVFELSRLHNLVTWYEIDPSKVTRKLVGLAAQVHQHLQLPLYKGTPLIDEPGNKSSVRESDWSQPLGPEQTQYAADDAYAGFRLYHVLESKRMRLTPIPPAVQVCDYDSLPTPRNKVTSKESQATRNRRVSTQIEKTQEKDGEENDEADEDDVYETAPEEIVDDQPSRVIVRQLPSEVANTRNLSQADLAPKQTPVPLGRVTLSWLQGLDPAYPVLPPTPTETERASSPSNPPDHISAPGVRFVGNVSKALYPEQSRSLQGDDFPDPELEEALKHLEIDDSGHLRPKPATPMVKGNQESTKEAIESALAAFDALSITDLSDFNTQDLDPPEPNQKTAPVFKPITHAPKQNSHTTEHNLATAWAQGYLQSTIPSINSTAHPHIRATATHLRVYHLWHHQKLPLQTIGTHMRDPPLSDNAVASHILQAVTLEKLTYEQEALRAAMMAMPSGLRNGRWKWMADKVGAN